MTTKGEFRVGIDFNPSGDDLVNRLKRAAADFIDLVGEIPSDGPQDGERARLKALAQTEIESAAMWAVKAATKKPMPAAFDTPQKGASEGDELFDKIVKEAVNSAPDGHSRDRPLHDFVAAALDRQGFLSVSDKDISDAIRRVKG